MAALGLGLYRIVLTGGPELHGPYEVINVVDGDTIKVKTGTSEVKVRMIGIDTPESVHADETRNTEEGKIASERTKELLEGEKVYLEYDLDPEDDYGRTLAYVYLDNKKTMVQEILLEEGYARMMTIQPNSKYVDEFYLIERKAMKDKNGFWGTGFYE